MGLNWQGGVQVQFLFFFVILYVIFFFYIRRRFFDFLRRLYLLFILCNYLIRIFVCFFFRGSFVGLFDLEIFVFFSRVLCGVRGLDWVIVFWGIFRLQILVVRVSRDLFFLRNWEFFEGKIFGVSFFCWSYFWLSKYEREGGTLFGCLFFGMLENFFLLGLWGFRKECFFFCLIWILVLGCVLVFVDLSFFQFQRIGGVRIF